MKSIAAYILIITLLHTAMLSRAGNPQKETKTDKGSPAFYKADVTVDGNASEWESALFYYDPDARIVYALANDSAALYVCLKVLGEEQQMMILHNGLEVWIDPAGKKKKVAGIMCPLNSPRLGNQRSRLKPGEKPDQQKMILQSILLVKEMTLTGFKEEINGTRHMDYNATGIRIVLSLDSTGALVYEAKIPFSVFKNDIRSAKLISLGCIIPSMDMPPVNGEGMPGGSVGETGRYGGGRSGGDGMPGGNMQGGGMPGGGGNGGEMRGGGRPDPGTMQNMNKETSFWHKARLAGPDKPR